MRVVLQDTYAPTDTASLRSELDIIMLERWNNRASYPVAFQAQIRRTFQFQGGVLPNGESEGRVVFERLMAGYVEGSQRDSGYEYTIDRWLEWNRITDNSPGLLFADNKERVTLISLAYQGWIKLDARGNPTGCPALAKALANDDRAEAWYEIRYNTNREGRRYSESELFGLYNNASNVGEADAKAAYRMVTRHRTELADIRLALSHGQPLGRDRFSDKICAATGIRRTQEGRGRPVGKQDQPGVAETNDFGF